MSYSREQKAEQLAKIEAKIVAACAQAKRPRNAVKLLAVSKTKPAEDVKEFLELGQCYFGENYVQEALSKIQEVANPKVEWHFIGTLQSNKAKFIPGNFALFHGLDSLTLARKLDAQAASHGKIVDALIEVQVHEQAGKGGMSVDILPGFLQTLASLKHLKIRGLMCLPDPKLQAKNPRRAFATLRETLEELNAKNAYPEKLTELSMGMTADFEAAILEGSTIVRIGTALFGERNKK